VELDPRNLSGGQVEAFCELGLNRASIGVQDLDPRVQHAIHRIPPTELNWRALALLRAAGVTSLNVDLIYGLPLQTPDGFQITLDEVLRYSPDRLAVFSYAHLPQNRPSQKILERYAFPCAEEKVEILVNAVERLLEGGYAHVGMDHFAKYGDSLAKAQRAGSLQRNFRGYSLHSKIDLIGFGMSSISQSHGSFRQNHRDLKTFHRMLDEGELPMEKGYLLKRDDRVRRDVIMRLMYDLELDFAERSRVNGIDFEGYFAKSLDALRPLEDDSLLKLEKGGLKVTALGRLLIRSVAACFDARLVRPEAHAKAI